MASSSKGTTTRKGPTMAPDPKDLRETALSKNPSKLPPNRLFDYTDTTIAIFDKYPKAIFHFLVLPRPDPTLTIFDLDTLRTLLNCKTVKREKIKEVLGQMGEHAKKMRWATEEEMVKRYGFKWDVWIGFHAVPSMHEEYYSHLHLHVISSDLCAPGMKTKKHYNSFHPKRGFFLHFDEVMEWFDAVPSFFERKISLKPSTYDPLLEHDLECWRCEQEKRNMPRLKEHLQAHFDQDAERARPKPKPSTSKRKREDGSDKSRSKASSQASDKQKSKATTNTSKLKATDKPSSKALSQASTMKTQSDRASVESDAKRRRTDESLETEWTY